MYILLESIERLSSTSPRIDFVKLKIEYVAVYFTYFMCPPLANNFQQKKCLNTCHKQVRTSLYHAYIRKDKLYSIRAEASSEVHELVLTCLYFCFYFAVCKIMA